jgi:uncharacterized ParB-like nuclease family protein
MVMSFLKSILTGRKNRSARNRKQAVQEDETQSFTADQEDAAAFEKVDRGNRYVPLDRIVGSVGRYRDLDRKFRLKPHVPSEKQEKIREAMRAGKDLPPVRLFQIRDQYYALDGNHRIAVAKELGREEIHAHVIEFLPAKKSPENILYLEKLDFFEQTGLEKDIRLTEFGQYRRLLDQIMEHRHYLEKQKGPAVEIKTAAQDWYQTIYLPLCAVIDKGRLVDHFSERSLADLYTYISFHHWQEDRKTRDHKYGIGINRLVPDNMEAFREKMAKIKESEYPEMLREITAFILMTVSGSKEYKIVDKLFELDEIKEIHSVHGNVDVIVKVVLQRNLVASDAETIGNFVHTQVRRINGIQSTQTLIPGYSKIKE